MTNENKSVATEPVVEMTEPVVEGPTPSKRKPKEKTRTLAELSDISEKRMSDAEKNKLIVAYREKITLLTNQNEALRKNCESAYSKLRDVDENAQRNLDNYRKAIDFNMKTIRHAYETMTLTVENIIAKENK